MTKLAIFTSPKAFTDAHINIIQRNAIASWAAMGPEVEVFIIGNEDGCKSAAKDLGVQHIPKIEKNAEGTPLVSSIFNAVRSASDAPLLAYINADIILYPESLSYILELSKRVTNFALFGQRYDLEIKEAIDFSTTWPEALRKRVREKGRLHPPGGSDYFIFPRNLFEHIPDFAIGRAGWDNWMIYHAVSAPWAAIDATSAMQVVHQDHDYAHLSGGQPHYRSEESNMNAELAGGLRHLYTLLDVNYEYRDGRLRKKRPGIARALRAIERRLQPNKRTEKPWRWALLRRLQHIKRNFCGVGR